MESAPTFVSLVDAGESAPGVDLGGAFGRAFGDGWPAGDAICLSGEPGAGKTTLAILAAVEVARVHGPGSAAIAVSESAIEMTLRLGRLAGLSDAELALVDVAPVDSWGQVLGAVSARRRVFLAVDSASDICDRDKADRGGWRKVLRAAKRKRVALVLLVHVNAEGKAKGDTALPHLCDGHAHLSASKLLVKKARCRHVAQVASDRALGVAS